MRPSNATITATTPNGVKFQYLLDDYKSKGARDAGMESLQVLIAWSDADDFLEEAVGFTTWDGIAATWQRTPPLTHPFREGFFVDEYDLVDMGAYQTRDDFMDPKNNNAPVQDWCIYNLIYTRPKYWVWDDKTLTTNPKKVLGNLGGMEQARYTMYSELPRPRERLVSSFGFIFDDSVAGDGSHWQQVPNETQFIPDWQKDIHVTLIQIPISSVPYDAIEAALNTVNLKPMQLTLFGKVWPPGWLLFKGLSEPYHLYFGADDNPYLDLAYLFTVQPGALTGPTTGGWNSYLQRQLDGSIAYKRVGIRPFLANLNGPITPAPLPPYQASDFQKLFQPAAS